MTAGLGSRLGVPFQRRSPPQTPEPPAASPRPDYGVQASPQVTLGGCQEVALTAWGTLGGPALALVCIQALFIQLETVSLQ